MSGLVRNLITLISALLCRTRMNVDSIVVSHFLITPLDCGVSTLKSDKYFQLAESAQLDFLVRTKLFGQLVSGGVSFVNSSQLVKFMKPVRLFNRIRVDTRIVFIDGKNVIFSHSVFSGAGKCSEVLVKMKFKKGSLTVDPVELLGDIRQESPPYVLSWNATLESIS